MPPPGSAGTRQERKHMGPCCHAPALRHSSCEQMEVVMVHQEVVMVHGRRANRQAHVTRYSASAQQSCHMHGHGRSANRCAHTDTWWRGDLADVQTDLTGPPHAIAGTLQVSKCIPRHRMAAVPTYGSCVNVCTSRRGVTTGIGHACQQACTYHVVGHGRKTNITPAAKWQHWTQQACTQVCLLHDMLSLGRGRHAMAGV